MSVARSKRQADGSVDGASARKRRGNAAVSSSGLLFPSAASRPAPRAAARPALAPPVYAPQLADEPAHRPMDTRCATLPGTYRVLSMPEVGPFSKLIACVAPLPVHVYVARKAAVYRPADFHWVASGAPTLAFTVPHWLQEGGAQEGGAQYVCAVYHGSPGRPGQHPDTCLTPLALEAFACAAPFHPAQAPVPEPAAAEYESPVADLPMLTAADDLIYIGSPPLLDAAVEVAAPSAEFPLEVLEEPLKETSVARIYRVNVNGTDLCLKEFKTEGQNLDRVRNMAFAEHNAQDAVFRHLGTPMGVGSDRLCRPVHFRLQPPQLFMEWMARGTLSSALSENLSSLQRAVILCDVAEGLVALHRNWVRTAAACARARSPSQPMHVADRALRHQAGQHHAHA
jgi:hypothetical protein